MKPLIGRRFVSDRSNVEMEVKAQGDCYVIAKLRIDRGPTIESVMGMVDFAGLRGCMEEVESEPKDEKVDSVTADYADSPLLYNS